MYVLRKRFEQTDAEVLHSRPYPFPVKVITSTTVAEIGDGAVVLQDKDFNRTALAVDEIVTCHTRPVLELFDELRAAGVTSSTSATRSGRATSITRSRKARPLAWLLTSSCCSTRTARS